MSEPLSPAPLPANSGTGSASAGILGNDLRSMIELFDESDLVEMAVERHGRRLYLRKSDQAPAAGDDREIAEPRGEPPVIPVNAHMVGTFEWSKDRQSTPGLAIGQEAVRGQLVGYIEAMGIMNEIEATATGRVVEIAVASGQPVEYGQLIILLAPAPEADAHSQS